MAVPRRANTCYVRLRVTLEGQRYTPQEYPAIPVLRPTPKHSFTWLCLTLGLRILRDQRLWWIHALYCRSHLRYLFSSVHALMTRLLQTNWYASKAPATSYMNAILTRNCSLLTSAADGCCSGWQREMSHHSTGCPAAAVRTDEIIKSAPSFCIQRQP